MLVAKVKGEKLKDDKTMIMERVIQLVSNLPSNSKLRVERYVGDKYQYRQADGSCNVGCVRPC